MKRDVSFAEFTREIVDALDAAHIEYLIGGSVAVWTWGEWRTTQDLDVVADLPDEAIEPLSAELMKREIMVPPDIMRDLIAEDRIDIAINAIHPFTGHKAEIFPVRPNNQLRSEALKRRKLVTYPEPIGDIYVHSPEDLILYKLEYYSISRQTKHDRDIASILASGHPLDTAYIERWAARLGLLDIWKELSGGSS
jgi:hypothetical protein